MPDNPRKKKQDRKRQSQQKHEVAYRNRARGSKSQSRKAGRSRRSSASKRSGPTQRSRSQSRASSARGQRSGGPSMRELLIEELADIYNAEKQVVRALPKMARGANSDQLRMAFQQHLDETRDQVRRIEQAFEALGERPRNKKCEGMEGLIKEGEHMMEEDFEGAVLDAALIAAAQKVEHYEIASYGTICTWAELLGENAALRFLKQNMSEEEATDKRLTDLALQINQEAQNQGGSEEEQEGAGEGSRGQGRSGIRDLVSRVFPS